MAYNGVDISIEPAYLSDGSYTPQNDRAWYNDIMRDGIITAGDFLVSAGTLFTLSVASGIALVQGKNVTDQGMYRVREPNTNANAIAITAADASKPRIDQLILIVMDATNDTSGLRKGRLELIPGVATTGATLNGREGAADLTTLTDNSKSTLLLADVLVPAAAITSAACTIRDRRKLTWPKNVPYVWSKVGSGFVANVAGETDLIVTQTIPGYMLRDSDYTGVPHVIEVAGIGYIENASGSTRTVALSIYGSRGNNSPTTQIWADTLISIPTSAIWRPIMFRLFFSITGTLTHTTISQINFFGDIALSGSGAATLGGGDVGAVPTLPFSPISSFSSVGPSPAVGDPNLNFNWKMTANLSAASASFDINIIQMITQIY